MFECDLLIMERKEFSKFLTDVYSHGALMSAIGLGHDLGLFRVFYDTDQPLSLSDIATKLNLKERFVCKQLMCFSYERNSEYVTTHF